MNNKENHINLIERYLDGEMSYEEVSVFEAELLSNNALREELEFYQLANSVIVENKIAEVKEVIREVAAEYSGKKDTDSFHKKIIGAGVTLLLIGSVFFFGKHYFWQDEETKTQTGNKKHSIQMEVLPETVPDRTLAPDNSKTEKNSTIGLDDTPNTTTRVHKKLAPVDTLSVSDTLAVIQGKESLKSESHTEKNPANSNPHSFNVDHDASLDGSSPEPDKCIGVSITARTDVRHTCAGKNEGRIQLKNVQGGTAPYHFQLSSGEESAHGLFADLEEGSYTVRIRDSHQCELVQNIELKAERCRLELYLDPVSGNPVVFPKYEKEGVLTIFDKQGNLKLEKRIPENQRYEWFGEGNTGRVDPGYYLFIIRYDNGIVQNGSITVVP